MVSLHDISSSVRKSRPCNFLFNKMIFIQKVYKLFIYSGCDVSVMLVVNTIDQDTLTSSLLSSVSSSWSRSVFVKQNFAMSKYKNNVNLSCVCLWWLLHNRTLRNPAGQQFVGEGARAKCKTEDLLCLVYWSFFHPICICICMCPARELLVFT